MHNRLLFLVVLALATACSDSNVGSNNSPPEATIEQPSVGTEVLEGSEVAFVGVVEDRGTSLAELDVSWSSSIDGSLHDGLADSDGNSTFATVDLSAGVHTITLQVRDGAGATGQATVDLVVRADAAPEITIDSPTAEGVYYSDFPVALQATVNDAEDLPADLRVSWAFDGGDTVVEDVTPDSGGTATNNSDFTAATHSLIATVTDTAGNTRDATVSFVVGPPNTAPTCEITAPGTESSFPFGDLVTFEGTVGDTDVPSDWLSAAFESNVDGLLGEVTPTTAGELLLAVSSLSAATHTVTLTVTDEVGGSCTDAILVTVSNPPEAEILTPPPGETYNDNDTLEFTGSVHDSEDADSNLLAEWASDIDGALGVSIPDSSGSIALNRGLSPGTHLIGLTATDSVGLTATDTVTVYINACPTTPTVSILPAVPSTQDNLNVSIDTPSMDPDDSSWTPTYSYEWTRNGVPMPGYSGLTTVPASATAALETWAVAVAPTDGACTSTPGAAAVAVGNSIPAITGASLAPPVGLNSDVFTVTPTGWSDLDGDPPGYQYQWYAAGSAVANATAATWTPNVSDPAGYPAGTSIWCAVTPWDGQSTGLPLISTLAAINTPPGVVGVAINPTPAYEDTVLTASYGLTNDVDGQSVSVTWEWSLNGNPIPAVTGTTLDGSAFGKGDSITVTATPHDGLESGAPSSSTAVVILNTAPSISGVSISPSGGTETTTFTCVPAGWADIDGDSPGYTWAWTVNGSPSVTSETIDGASFDAGDVLDCSVTPTDGSALGTSVPSSNTVTVGNTAPGAPSVSLSPSSPTDVDDLVCSISGAATDIDPNDTHSYDFEWFDDTGTSAYILTAGDVTDTLIAPSSATSAGESWTCEVTAHDGTDYGPAGSATTAPLIVFCLPGDGTAPACAATDCSTLLDTGFSTGDANYWIDGGGSVPFEVYCDMTTDGGGWTLIAQGGSLKCGAAGSSLAVAGDMTDTDSCSYLEHSKVQQLASLGGGVRLQVGDNSTAFGDWTSTARSLDSLAIDALLTLGGTWHNGATWDNWDWAVSCTPYMSTGWPNMFQACGNGWDVHWISTNYLHSNNGATANPNQVSATWVGGISTDLDGDGYFSYEDCDDNDPLAFDDNGASSSCAGDSCLDILTRGYSIGDGSFWIDPDSLGGSEVYCDMSTDGGGWTLLATVCGDEGLGCTGTNTDFFTATNDALPFNLWTSFSHYFVNLSHSQLRMTHLDLSFNETFALQVQFNQNLFLCAENSGIVAAVLASTHPSLSVGSTAYVYVNRTVSSDEYTGVGLSSLPNSSLRHGILEDASRSNYLMTGHFDDGSDKNRKNDGTAGTNSGEVDSAYGRIWVR